MAGSKGKKCLGPLKGNLKCTRARNGSGNAIFLNKNCLVCGEQRCRFHCKCGRLKESGESQGRSAPRGRAPRPAAKPKPAPVPVQAPVGRASAESCKLLTNSDWHQSLRADVASATQVELSSYMYNNLELHKALLKRLKDKTRFSLAVYVDSEKHLQEGCKGQKKMLAELAQCGASVFFCKGGGRQGSYHCKAAGNFFLGPLGPKTFCSTIVKSC